MKAVEHKSHDEESNGWPWIIEARARDAKATSGMTIDEKVVYYRRMAVIARAEREQQEARVTMMGQTKLQASMN